MADVKAKAAPKTGAKDTTNNFEASCKASNVALDSAIIALTTASGSFAVAADKAMRMAITHCNEFNDPSGVQRMYESVAGHGKIIGPRRQQQILKFLKAFTPIRRNSKTENFGLLKSTAPNYVEYDMDGVNSVSWLNFETDSAPRVNTMTMDKLAESIAKRMFKAMNEAEWPADGAFDKASVTRKTTAAFNKLVAEAAANA